MNKWEFLILLTSIIIVIVMGFIPAIIYFDELNKVPEINNNTYLDASSDVSRLITFDDYVGEPSNGIPKVLFRTSEFELTSIPSAFKNLFVKILNENKDYTMVYFSGKDRERFIKLHYPQYYESYDRIIPGAYKADIFRNLVVYHYGGIYNDIGNDFLIPIDKIVNHDTDTFVCTYEKLVFFPSHRINNAFLAATKNNEVLRAVIDHIDRNVANKTYGENHVDITGPSAI